MQGSNTLRCDGCGLPAAAEHIARRLKRLENMTRYRPIHVQTLFLAAVTPNDDGDHLYTADGNFRGEGEAVLRAVGIEHAGRSVEDTLTAFQRAGLLLTHVVDCPMTDPAARKEVLQQRLPATLTRIRRSYKPKRVVLVGKELERVVTQVTNGELGTMIILDGGRPFDWEGLSAEVLANLAVKDAANEAASAL